MYKKNPFTYHWPHIKYYLNNRYFRLYIQRTLWIRPSVVRKVEIKKDRDTYMS